jgi:diadenylate cyclase
MTIATVEKLCAQISWCEPSILQSTVELALEIAREGREGRRIGTLFTIGEAEAVLAASRALILDPLAGHAPSRTHVSDPDLRGTIKELAQLDGAFVISATGTVVAACRYLDASVEQIDLPLGFGSRHLAAASVSQRLGAVAIVVSESGVVRVFHGGQIEATLIPELWLLDRHHTQLSVAAAGALEARRLGASPPSGSRGRKHRGVIESTRQQSALRRREDTGGDYVDTADTDRSLGNDLHDRRHRPDPRAIVAHEE